MRFIPCLLLVSSCCCAVADEPVITLPDIHAEIQPVPCPEPQQPSAPVLTPETIYVVQSTVPLIALQSPGGLLKLTTESGPIRIRGRFIDGDGKIETRSYAAKYLVFVDGVKPGTTELILIPQGVTAEKDIVRQMLTVSGEAPRPPPPGPGPGPVPPEPKPPVAKNVMLSIVEDPTVRTAETAIVLESLLGWSEFKSSGNDWLLYDQKTTEPKGVTAKQQIGATPVPAVAITDKTSGKLIHAGPLPDTPESLKELILKLTGAAQ